MTKNEPSCEKCINDKRTRVTVDCPHLLDILHFHPSSGMAQMVAELCKHYAFIREPEMKSLELPDTGKPWVIVKHGESVYMANSRHGPYRFSLDEDGHPTLTKIEPEPSAVDEAWREWWHKERLENDDTIRCVLDKDWAKAGFTAARPHWRKEALEDAKEEVRQLAFRHDGFDGRWYNEVTRVIDKLIDALKEM